MRGLGATITEIRRQNRQVRALTALAGPACVPHPPAHLSEMEDFGANPGNLQAWFYAPPRLRPDPALIVALHGCGQCADDFDRGAGWSALAPELNAILLFPEQKPFNNRRMCFNWFQPRDVACAGGEAQSVRQMILALSDRLRVAHGRAYITGLSAGAAMAAALLAQFPDLFTAGAMIAGMPFGAAGNALEALDAMADGSSHMIDLAPGKPAGAAEWPRVSFWQGAADVVVHPRNAEMQAEQWARAHRLSDPAVRREGRLERRVWRTDRGEAAVELVMIDGLGHAAPIDSRRAGTPRGFMVDIGIDSSRAIAEFWGLAPKAQTPRPAAATPGGLVQKRTANPSDRRPRLWRPPGKRDATA